jgi:hypothetical protein
MPLAPARTLRQFKYAMYFNGVNAYVLVSSSMIGSVLSNPPLTLDIWFYSPPDYGKTYTYLSSYGGAYKGFYLQKIATNQLVLFIGTGSSWSVVGISTLPFRFIDVAGVVDINNALLYIDASLVGRATPSSYAPGSTTLGICSHPVNPPFTPAMTLVYRVLLYTRILGVNEVQWNYNNPDNPVRGGLVLWFQADPQYIKDIDNDGVLEWIDLSGNGNHGKIYGARLVQLVRDHARVLKPVRVLSPVR